MSPAQKRITNNDAITDVYNIPNSGTTYLALLFPERRSLNGVFFNHGSNVTVTGAEWSNDTTDGLDGVWTTVGGVTSYNLTDKRVLRTHINTPTVSDATAFRLVLSLGSNRGIRNLHVYGAIAPNQSPDRLRVVDMTNTSTTGDDSTPTGEDIAAQLDFGNIPQRNSATRQFKVVNNSASQTANNITVSLDAPADASPSLIGQYQISTDNVAFANAVNIGSLAPGADSGSLYLRNVVANNASLSVWSARILAQATDWS